MKRKIFDQELGVYLLDKMAPEEIKRCAGLQLDNAYVMSCDGELPSTHKEISEDYRVSISTIGRWLKEKRVANLEIAKEILRDYNGNTLLS